MNSRTFQFSMLLWLLFFLSCSNSNKEEENPLPDQDLLGNLVTEFQTQTGIKIFYEPGDSELQNQLETDHSVGQADYPNVPHSELLFHITKLINRIDEFPIEFIENIELDGILVVDSNQPSWSGHASKRKYSSVAFNGLNYLDNNTLIAHELFHIFDPGLPIFSSGSNYETSWSVLNPPNFEYGDGCEITSGLNSNPSTGFINDYSRCNPFEDRAIVFSFLYAKNDEIQMLREMDSFLNDKAEFIESLVSAYDFSF